jgi:copper chaperone CopZ
MKNKLNFMLLVLFTLFSINMYAQKTDKKAKETVMFHVPMDCMSCKNKIEKNIAYEKGVTDMDVNLQAKTVKVTFRSDKNTVEGLIAAFKKIGFEATVIAPETEQPAEQKAVKHDHDHDHDHEH